MISWNGILLSICTGSNAFREGQERFANQKRPEWKLR